MRLPLLLAAVSLVAAACDVRVGDGGGISVGLTEGRASDEWVRTYALPQGGQLEIVNENGEIDVSRTEGRDVEIRAERQVRADTDEEAQALLAAVDMQEDVTPDRVRIEARLDGLTPGRRPALGVRYEVRVPAGLVLTFRTGTGEIDMASIEGIITASTTNGQIEGRVSGSLVAETVNGGIEIEFAALSGDVELSTTNGSIELDLPAGVDAELEATCVNGRITVDEALRLQATENSRRRVAGTLNAGGPRIAVRTVNGGIRLALQD